MRFATKEMRLRIASDRQGRMVHCDSYLEKDFFIQLDFDPSVLAWRDHPFPIPYLYEGRVRTYTPDAVVLRRKSSGLVRQMVEVKSTYLLAKPECARILEVGSRFCSMNGWEYRLVTEQEIRTDLLENIKQVRRYRRQRPPLRCLLTVRESLNAKGGSAPIAQLAAVIERVSSEANPIPYIYALLYNKELFADLQSPLTPGTLVGISPIRQ